MFHHALCCLGGEPDREERKLYIMFYLAKWVQKYGRFLYSNILKVYFAQVQMTKWKEYLLLSQRASKYHHRTTRSGYCPR